MCGSDCWDFEYSGAELPIGEETCSYQFTGSGVSKKASKLYSCDIPGVKMQLLLTSEPCLLDSE